MQIGVVGKSFQRLPHCRNRTHAQGRTEVDFTDSNAVFAKRGEGFGGFLIFTRQMADVVVDPQEIAPALVARHFVGELPEKSDGFRRGLEQSQGLGLKAKMQGAPGGGSKRFHVIHAFPEIPPDGTQLVCIQPESLE